MCIYLLTPWCRVLLEKLTGLQLVNKFSAFHGNRMFITALTRVRQLSVSWASAIQSIYPHPTSWRSVQILYTHLRLGLTSGLLPSGFPTETLYTSLSSPICVFSWNKKEVIDCKNVQSGELQIQVQYVLCPIPIQECSENQLHCRTNKSEVPAKQF